MGDRGGTGSRDGYASRRDRIETRIRAVRAPSARPRRNALATRAACVSRAQKSRYQSSLTPYVRANSSDRSRSPRANDWSIMDSSMAKRFRSFRIHRSFS